MPRQSRGRSSAAPRAAPAPAPAQTRSAHTAAAPAAAHHAPPPAPAPPVAAAAPAQTSSGPGMLAQMAATAGSVAVGSTIGHGLSHMLFGGSSSSAPAEAPAAPVQQQQTFNNTASCEVQAKDFTRCLEKADLPSCQWYLDALKASEVMVSQSQAGKTKTAQLTLHPVILAPTTPHQLDIPLPTNHTRIRCKRITPLDTNSTSLIHPRMQPRQLNLFLPPRLARRARHHPHALRVLLIIRNQDTQVILYIPQIIMDITLHPARARGEINERAMRLRELDALAVALRRGGPIVLVPREEPERQRRGDLHALEEELPALRALEARVRLRRAGSEGLQELVRVRVGGLREVHLGVAEEADEVAPGDAQDFERAVRGQHGAR
ncbi:hypothetical protein H0H92_010445 [Tricholoma furcatifolium]|nr:hypothetical protein H0H92_010445 [Tricholoma furcatifolium]